MKHWKTILAAIAAALLPILTACTLGGAVAGGVIGHEVTHSPAGTIGGAVAGGIIGHELGQ
ncbi:glycine zipper 2TM domain-containing protein [Ralstonia pseudosolanacearum]|uniref:Glycine zipper 2TM domain-containing protein n=2 Tax=Ralstonia solanacearum species complex TaxID=3116862 RepID=A0A0S4WBM0_RALSL|nr:glycine zipper 2TM domain-containing protein [Ralstonia pseudosolanacearum]APC66902.1 glycine zipper 2TM domain-containing protein [Ralstonia solanacearum OE1-1]ARU24565.1 Sirohydrochlorin cobaltochelatase [Ralstonia solanacearum]ASL75672.1 glycine zipper 2TM domain [Ralstonia pseudosolanacearum]AUS45586.1 glycine zipper 2TM domain-containing protein [Ralstonia solanacearum]AYA49462.1 glycine zipper 2TM domain-containing protein [Ralstonia pseudosolanacearum]